MKKRMHLQIHLDEHGCRCTKVWLAFVRMEARTSEVVVMINTIRSPLQDSTVCCKILHSSQ